MKGITPIKKGSNLGPWHLIKYLCLSIIVVLGLASIIATGGGGGGVCGHGEGLLLRRTASQPAGGKYRPRSGAVFPAGLRFGCQALSLDARHPRRRCCRVLRFSPTQCG